MNKKRKSHEEWLDRQSYEQLEWTGKYLGLWNGPTISGVDYNQILGELKRKVTTTEETEGMRKLWRLEKHRKHSGLKNYNFALPQQAASKLRKIAKRRPLRHVLAEMIEKEMEYEARLKEEVDAATSSIAQKFKLVSMRSERGLELVRTQKELDALSVKVFYLLGEVSGMEVSMKNNGLTVSDLADEQKSEAESRYSKMKEEFFGNRLAAVEALVKRLAAKQEVRPDSAPP